MPTAIADPIVIALVVGSVIFPVVVGIILLWFGVFLASGFFCVIVLELDESWRWIGTFGAPTLLLLVGTGFLLWCELRQRRLITQ